MSLNPNGSGNKAIHFDTGNGGCKANANYGLVCKFADYQYIRGGEASICPSGKAIAIAAECGEAGLALGFKFEDGYNAGVADWANTPCWCIVWNSFDGLADDSIQFDTGSGGCKSNTNFDLICKA
jgi:hypothetical protein